MKNMTRRAFLARAGAAGAGLTLARGWSVAPAAASAPAVGTPVPGAYASVYKGFGVPRGLRLSFTGDVTSSRTITWLTTGDADPGSTVQLGVVPLNASPEDVRSGRFLDREIRGTSEPAPYGFGEPDDERFGQPLDDEHPVRVHSATMTDLRQGETIAYRVGSGAAWSEVHTFRATPRRDEGFTFTHFGDHGAMAASRRATAAVAAVAPDFHLVAGDISYANGDQRVWDVWANEFEPLGTRVPVLFAPGNHEAKDFLGETYRRRFVQPNHGAAWFSIDYHNVHIVSTTAGAFLSQDDPSTAQQLVVGELVWLERDLAEAAARRAAGEIDFIVVTQHFPLYTDHRTRGPFSPQLVAAQEQIFQRYQIDLLLVGHDHMYQRSKAMAYGVPTGFEPGQGAGYVQIVAGAGGKSLYEFTPIDTTELASDPENPWMRWSLWSAAFAREFSFVSYAVEAGLITARAFGWADVEGQNDIPQDPATYDAELVAVDPDGIDPNLPAREIDTFTLTRKPGALVVAAAVQPRRATAILAGVPEARGVVVRNLAEDCTRHHE